MQQVTGATNTRYTQDLASPLSQVLAIGTTTYIYGNERLYTQSGGTKTWYGTDALGSVRQTLSNTGAVQANTLYDPWGVVQVGSVPTFGFTGEVQDGANVYLRARWYNTSVGTFTAKDPFAGFAEQPYSFAPYQYGYANPVRNSDPSGQVVSTGSDGTRCLPSTFGRCVVDTFLANGSTDFDLYAVFAQYPELARATVLENDPTFQQQEASLQRLVLMALDTWRAQDAQDRGEDPLAYMQAAAMQGIYATGAAGLAEGQLQVQVAGMRAASSVCTQATGNAHLENDVTPDSYKQPSSKVYRVQGGTPPKASLTRIRIGKYGEMEVVGDDMLFVTFDDIGRARAYVSNNRPGAEIISFEVDASFVSRVRRAAVPQAQGRNYPDAPQIADPTKTSDSFGLPAKWINQLTKAAHPGTGRIER